MNRPPLSNDTIDSVLRHREVGRAKDLSAPPRVGPIDLREVKPDTIIEDGLKETCPISDVS